MAGIEIIVRAIIERDGKILLVRKPGKNYSFLPGGHTEHGESAKSALSREILEETGLKADVLEFLGVVEHYFETNNSFTHEVNLIFAVELTAAEVLSLEKHIEFFWHDIDDLASVNIQPYPLANLLTSKGKIPFWASTLENRNDI